MTFFTLSLVVDSVSVLSFNDFVQKNILDTIQSAFCLPSDSTGRWYGVDSNSAGAFYSNTQDLLAGDITSDER
ncbi:hypothetical protein F5Y06DRAFT_292526 [Hypoxylon sp. FL0890]|nr:hypothetical protein F5Y06DRAFT_292526 [Hypoxylon sp. FL0890]